MERKALFQSSRALPIALIPYKLLSRPGIGPAVDVDDARKGFLHVDLNLLDVRLPGLVGARNAGWRNG